MNQDQEQIKILGIFHFVVAGIAGLIACFPIFNLIMGVSMLTGSFFGDNFSTGSSSAFPGIMFGLLFTIVPIIFIFVGWAFAICLAIAGVFMLNKKAYMYCLIMAGIDCVFMPFGTVLGVFTIIVLMRPSVRELFHRPNTQVKVS